MGRDAIAMSRRIGMLGRVPRSCSVCAVSMTIGLAGVTYAARPMACLDAVAAAPGDVFALGAGRDRVFHVPSAGTVDELCVPPDTVAVATGRDGTLYALADSGLSVFAIDPLTDEPPDEIVLSSPIDDPVDIAVAESGGLVVLEGCGTDGQAAVMLVDPDTGNVQQLSPPIAAPGDDPPGNYLGASGAATMSIALVPGGDLIVAQMCGVMCQIVRITPAGAQTLYQFALPAGVPAMRLAADALPYGQALVVTDRGDLILFTFASSTVQELGALAPSPSTGVDVAVAGVRHAYVACGGLFDLRWSTTGSTWSATWVDDIAGTVIGVAIHRGPVAPASVLAGCDFDDATQFEQDVYVDVRGGNGSAGLLDFDYNSVLHMLAGVSVTGQVAPVGILMELRIPANAIRMQCAYRFLSPYSQINVYVNGRFAGRIVAPPDGRPGSPTSSEFGIFTRQINLGRLGLLGAPRLAVELVLGPTTAGLLPVAEAYLDDLVFLSSTCSSVFGDLYIDGLVDQCDVEFLAEHYGDPDCPCCDLNQDGYVDALDFASLLAFAARGYEGGLCPQAREQTPDEAARDDPPPTMPTVGNLLILAKDVDWSDWVYEVAVSERSSVATCVGRFRLPDPCDPNYGVYTYTQLRHDGHGVLYTVDFQQRIGRWDPGPVTFLYSEPFASELEAHGWDLAGLGPVDVALTRGTGAWVSFAPCARSLEIREESGLVHFDEEAFWLDWYLDDAYTRARTLLATGPTDIWAVNASFDSGDTLVNIVREPHEYHEIAGVPAVVSTDLTCDRAWLHIGSAAGEELGRFLVASGMSSVSEDPPITYELPEASAVTGAAHDPLTGDLYICGFRASGLPRPFMEPLLRRIPPVGDPVDIVFDCDPVAMGISMPLSIVVYRPAPKGDFDADFGIDLSDFGQFQTCFAEQPAYCLDDFDFDADSDVDFADFEAFVAVFETRAK